MVKEINKYFFNNGTRNSIRQAVVLEFFNEEAGDGKGDLASKYIYYVETLSDGNRIYLQRPAHLNKGFDFIIKVENIQFRDKGSLKYAPSHSNIIEDLKNKKNENVEEYNRLFKYIESIFNCNEIESEWFYEFSFTTGKSVELLLKVIKWLFIEQDITYWNYSGRNMLMNGIREI